MAGRLKEQYSGPRVAWQCCVLAYLTGCLLLGGCRGQGRLVDPPSRASMWRYDFSNPVDFNDDRVDCGGFVRQWRKNRGRCGVCGDPWDVTEPRAHETRGKYGRGILVRNYTQAQAVVVEVEVTAASSGHFEYQLCPRSSAWTQETQDCFTHALKDDLDRSRIPVNVMEKFARLRHVLRLPHEMVCLACILQWKFITVGRAGRTEYRACADITITPTTTTTASTTASTTTETLPTTEDTTQSSQITVESIPEKFDSPSRVAEVNTSRSNGTPKPSLQVPPQLDAPPTHDTRTRMNDVTQNDSGGNGGSRGVVVYPVALHYMVIFYVVLSNYISSQ